MRNSSDLMIIFRKFLQFCSRQNGYIHSFAYHAGVLDEQFVGWKGNSTLDYETFIEDTVTMKKENTLIPKASLRFKKDGKFINKEVRTEILKPLYPVGRCLKVVYPNESETTSLSGIIVEINRNENDNNSSLIVLLRDQNSGFKKCF